MDLTPSVSDRPKHRVALLIDGENISAELAGRIIREALSEGDVVIRRVYGNVALMPKWCAAPGFKVVHSGTGKNATDLLLSIEAMSLMLCKQAEVLCVAASDGDYTHLATHLRETGLRVVGLGEGKSSERLRKAFSRFREVMLPETSTAVASLVARPKEQLRDQVVQLIRDEGSEDGFSIVKLSGRMHALHKTRISDTPEKTWRKFLEVRNDFFHCDGKGSDAKVRLCKSSS